MFKDSYGREVSEERRLAACKAVAYDYRKSAIKQYNQNLYAPHVTEAEKLDNVTRSFKQADRIESGDIATLTVWQRVNEYLTGECISILP